MRVEVLPFLLAVVASSLPAAPHQAPPTPPPIEVRESVPRIGTALKPSTTPTEYSIGQPTDEEQFYLELINRARMFPVAEAELMANHPDAQVQSAIEQFGVNTNTLYTAIAAIAPAPPLAMNPKLTAAARLHSGDMFTNVFQGHVGTDGGTLGQRIDAQGYNWQNIGENVFSTVQSVVYGHAGFEIDWGPGTDGMQDPPGHRNSIHNATFREVGIGVVIGSNSSGDDDVGPELVTQDFGRQQGDTPFITGVAYYDLNGNGFYDQGEGLGGITVNVSGADFFAVTADAGGYAVPVSGNGSYAVTFSGPNLTSYQTNVTVANLENVKADFMPVYVAPQVTGSTSPVSGEGSSYSFAAVGGATSHEWKFSTVTSFAAVEGAESGTNTVLATVTSSEYDPVATDIKASGSASFHLAHPRPGPGLAPEEQIIQLAQTIRPRAGSQLQFAARLTFAISNQVARAEVSTDDGANWQTVWSRPGNDGATEVDSAFTSESVSLAAFVGQEIRVRFVYDHATSGSFFPQTFSGVGFYLDDISISDADEIGQSTTASVSSGTSFVFTPPAVGSYVLSVRGINNTRRFPYGPGLDVTAVAPAVQAPAITGQPAGVVTNLGAVVLLSVTATGDNLAYQWHRNGVDVANETDSLISIMASNRAAGGNYTVVVSNTAGQVTSEVAVVRVRVPQELQLPSLVGGTSVRMVFGDNDGGVLSSVDLAHLQVQATTDFTNWTTLVGSLVLTNNGAYIDDPDGASLNSRFYRVVEQ